MKRLGLLVAGVQKAATTTLHGMLSTLPGLAGPVGRKELHFFDDDAATDWRQPDYAPLHAAFAGAPADATWFESTPATLFWPGALARVRDYNPAMKLVLVFRDPVERAVSAWRMERARGVEPLGFAEALAAEDARCAGAGGGLRQFAYRRRGLYGAQLEAALALFPREQLLLLRFEDVVGQPDETLARIARFAGVAEPGGPVTPQRLNAGASTALAEPEALAALADAYRDDLIRFLELSRLEIAHWRSFVLAREGRHAATTDAMGLPRRDDPRQHAVPVCSHGPVFGNLVLLLRGGRRHPVPNAECLTAHGYRFPEDIVAVDDRVLLSCVPAQPLGRSLPLAAFEALQPRTVGEARQWATSQLAGEGIEFGAAASPFPVPLHALVSYADVLRYEELLEGLYAGQQAHGLVDPTRRTDLDKPDALAAESLDFIIASHVIEHLRNPIGTILACHRALRPGGHLVLAVPEKTRTFDRRRPDTSLDHLLLDHAHPSSLRDQDHYREFFELAEGFEGLLTKRGTSWMDEFRAGYSIHMHVWTHASFAAMIDHVVGTIAPFSGRWMRPAADDGIEFYCVLRK